ncbi:uncharacterized protein HD556DRAFT_993 [Suillus plorans]|uniref:Secreted protein n=1 Tax=Suillus plorans TaxID=116603 RepID=A0A9P7J9I0_9AGAM|nr:uncharacterized protein HD556DRAFT_993 [Suillus plorans]KAG1809765.1 hypothetical protein HD556DRAFT_993 [Suillus plorans]
MAPWCHIVILSFWLCVRHQIRNNVTILVRACRVTQYPACKLRNNCTIRACRPRPYLVMVSTGSSSQELRKCRTTLMVSYNIWRPAQRHSIIIL